jgi:hypothetical protein
MSEPCGDTPTYIDIDGRHPTCVLPADHEGLHDDGRGKVAWEGSS